MFHLLHNKIAEKTQSNFSKLLLVLCSEIHKSSVDTVENLIKTMFFKLIPVSVYYKCRFIICYDSIAN